MKIKLFSFAAFAASLLISASMFTSCTDKADDMAPAAEPVLKATGKITWSLVKVANPTADQKDAYAKITTAMNAAVARYNKWGNWGRVLTVRYTPGVPTAQASINGSIDFGTNRSYMTECTAMHEMSHCFGVGTAAKWSYPLIQNYLFVGAKAVAKLRSFDGSSAVINTGGQHFWPYGLNYNSEWSTTAGDRNAQIVRAMNDDGL
jgi:hypothetical protein